MNSPNKLYNNARILKRIYSYAWPFKVYIYWAILLTFLLIVFGVIRPLITQYIIDNPIHNHLKEQSIIWSSFLLLFVILGSISQYLHTYITGNLGQKVIYELRKTVFHKIIKSKISYFDKTPIGSLVTRTISDIETISEIFSQGLISISADILQLIVITAIMFYLDWQLALLSFSIIPFLIIAARYFQKGVKVSFVEVRKYVSAINSYVQEHLMGIELIKIFNKQDQASNKFEEINAQHLYSNVKSVWYYSIFFPIIEILTAISIGLIIWWSLYMDTKSAGIMVSFILYINMFFRPVRLIADRFNTMQMGMVASQRVFELLDNIDIEELYEKGTYVYLKGKIEFKNVGFYYQNQQWVLQDISFKIEEGKTLAIIGTTGSGKTTLIQLINKFLIHQKGDIYIDDQNIETLSIACLRSQIGVISQDLILFSGTLRDNINLFDHSITDIKIIEMASQLGISSFIGSKGEKLDLLVTERGNSFSEGEKQLISILRTWVHQPKIIIMDEASSSIDSISEESIQLATEKILQGRTNLIIAHRLSTIEHADKIIVLEHGKIIEQGTPKELILQKGKYFQLLNQ